MKSLMGLVVLFLGAMGAILWAVSYPGSDNYAYDCVTYGEETAGICIGGPAFMIMFVAIVASMWLDEREAKR